MFILQLDLCQIVYFHQFLCTTLQKMPINLIDKIQFVSLQKHLVAPTVYKPKKTTIWTARLKNTFWLIDSTTMIKCVLLSRIFQVTNPIISKQILHTSLIGIWGIGWCVNDFDNAKMISPMVEILGPFGKSARYHLWFFPPFSSRC